MTAWFLAGCLVGAMFGFTLGAFIVGLLTTARQADDQARVVTLSAEAGESVESIEEAYGYSFPGEPDRAPEPIPRVREASEEVGPPAHNPLRGHSLRRYPPVPENGSDREGLPRWLDGITPS
ncbi:hypothetical protein ACFL3S_05655 [Gemmatimonadota bacterium]